jgi:hypothetical protein
MTPKEGGAGEESPAGGIGGVPQLLNSFKYGGCRGLEDELPLYLQLLLFKMLSCYNFNLGAFKFNYGIGISSWI